MTFAFIGSVGHWGYAAKYLASASDAEVIGCASGPHDEDMSRVVGAFKRQGRDVPLLDDYRVLLDQRPDIAVIACWFCDTAEVAVEAQKRGIGVYLEKPVSVTWEGLAALEQAHAVSGAPLGAMLAIRCEPYFQAIKRVAESGALGDIRVAHGQKSYKLGTRGPNFQTRELYGGTIPWVGIHAIDWVRWLTGKEFVTAAAAHSTAHNGGNGEMEATSSCLFSMEDGVIATVSADYLRPVSAARHDDDRVRLTGTRGMAEIIHQRLYLETDDIPGRREMPLAPAVDPFADFLAAAVSPRTAAILASDAFAVTRAALAARDAADTGGVVRIQR